MTSLMLRNSKQQQYSSTGALDNKQLTKTRRMNQLDDLDSNELKKENTGVDMDRYYFEVTKIEKASFKVTGRQNIAWIKSIMKPSNIHKRCCFSH